MARTEGSRNQNYESRRLALLSLARARLALPGGSRASFRDLAAACGVSVPTLRHYFARREDLVIAVLAQARADGEVHLAHMRLPEGPFAASVRAALGYAAFGFQQGVGELHTIGLTEGLGDGDMGPHFVNLVLEPSIAALQARLEAHVASGEMDAVDTRHAALALLSPVVLLMLHQRELGGASQYPTDIDRFLDDHAAAFIRGYGKARIRR